MSNVATFEKLSNAAPYMKEGVTRAIRFLRQYAPWFEQIGDGLTMSVTSPLSTTVTSIKASAGHLYAVIIESGSSAAADCYIQVFDVASGSVSLGTTAPTEVFKCPAGKTRTIVVSPGSDSQDLYDTAISIAATTTHDGLTALASASQPTVTVLYA